MFVRQSSPTTKCQQSIWRIFVRKGSLHHFQVSTLQLEIVKHYKAKNSNQPWWGYGGIEWDTKNMMRVCSKIGRAPNPLLFHHIISYAGENCHVGGFWGYFIRYIPNVWTNPCLRKEGGASSQSSGNQASASCRDTETFEPTVSADCPRFVPSPDHVRYCEVVWKRTLD